MPRRVKSILKQSWFLLAKCPILAAFFAARAEFVRPRMYLFFPSTYNLGNE